MRLWPLGVFLGAFSATALGQSGNPDLIGIATRYIVAQQAVMQKGAGPRDVDALMGFYSADYTYYHPQFGAKVTGLVTVRNGITSHLGETTDVDIAINGILTDGNMVSLALSESFVDAATGKRFERSRMTVLTIKNGKITQRVDM